MKSFKTSIYFFVIALLAGFTLSGCEPEEDDDDDDHQETHQHLFLSFQQNVGNDELVLNQPYVSDSVTFTISRINYYLSSFRMQIDHEGNYQSYDSIYILVDENTANMELGEIPEGEMHGLEFAIGVEDSMVNHSDPATYPSSHALAPQNPSMHWGWNSGYIFFAIEGMVDTNGDGTVDTDLEMHVGLDKNVAHHTKAHHFDVVTGTDVTLNVELDLLEVFEGIDLSTQYLTHSMGAGDALAMQIAANLEEAFTAE